MNSVAIKKSGFTLVELLVVITIIGVIATVSAINYLPVLKRTKLDNVVENVVLAVKESKLKTLAGEGLGVSAPSRCYGVYFKPDAVSGEYVLNQVYADYVDGMCNWSDLQVVSSVGIDAKVSVGNIIIKGTGVSKQILGFVLYFTPPEGEMNLSGYQDPVSMEVEFLYNSENSALYKRALYFDLVTGRIDYAS